jgi:hypothetical protein
MHILYSAVTIEFPVLYLDLASSYFTNSYE